MGRFTATAALLASAALGASGAAAGPKADEGGAASVFDDTRVHTVHVVMEAADFDAIGKKPFEWAPGDVEFDGVRLAKCGIREKGNSSWSVRSGKKPFKIDVGRYEKGRTFRGLRVLVLNNGFKDPSFLREKLAYDLHRAIGLPASRAAFAEVFVTAVGRFEKERFGLYTLVEHVDEAFLDDRFGGHAGNLYKVEGIEDLFAGRDARWIGDERNVELKTNEEANDRSRLAEFARAVAEGRGDWSKWIDLPRFAKWLAATVALVNLDSYAGTGHNVYLYDDPKTGRFVLIPWDLNEAFGNFQVGDPTAMLDWDVSRPMAGPKRLIERFVESPAPAALYGKELKSLVSKELDPAATATRIEALARLVRDAIARDTKKEWPTEECYRSIAEDLQGTRMGPKQTVVFGLKPFVTRRVASIREQLDGKRRGIELRGPMGPPPGGPPGFGPPGFPPGPPPGGGDPIRDMDVDGDGKVSRAEWRGPPDEFDRIDRNRDGFLDAVELRR